MTMTDARPETDQLLVLDHGFVRLDDHLGDDLCVVNAARVSFGQRSETLGDRDAGLIRFLMRERHGSPFEHNAFRFHIKCPIFVAREWMRHRVGCLAPDAEVTFVDTNGQSVPELRKSMAELWRMWSEGESNGRGVDRTTLVRRVGTDGPAGLRDASWRLRGMRLRVLDESTNEFTTGHVAEVFDAGIQPVFRVRLADGKQLTMTEKHQVLTDAGWRSLRDAVGLVGEGHAARVTRRCRLMVNGLLVDQDREWMAAQRRSGASVSEIAEAARVGYTPSETHRAAVSRARSGPKSTGCRLTAHPVEVVAVEFLGTQQTYDLSVDGPHHNFVANGIVVHNSFNERSARYSQMPDEFYVPATEDVRTQVGKPGSYTFEAVDDEVAEHARETLEHAYQEAYEAYQRLLADGVAKEVARSVLPVGLYTEFYWTVNARSLMNFVSLRNSETAQLEIRRYAEAVEELWSRHMPHTHAAFVENARTAP
jgi:thymidylate synthase ThyX